MYGMCFTGKGSSMTENEYGFKGLSLLIGKRKGGIFGVYYNVNDNWRIWDDFGIKRGHLRTRVVKRKR